VDRGELEPVWSQEVSRPTGQPGAAPARGSDRLRRRPWCRGRCAPAGRPALCDGQGHAGTIRMIGAKSLRVVLLRSPPPGSLAAPGAGVARLCGPPTYQRHRPRGHRPLSRPRSPPRDLPGQGFRPGRRRRAPRLRHPRTLRLPALRSPRTRLPARPVRAVRRGHGGALSPRSPCRRTCSRRRQCPRVHPAADRGGASLRRRARVLAGPDSRRPRATCSQPPPPTGRDTSPWGPRRTASAPSGSWRHGSSSSAGGRGPPEASLGWPLPPISPSSG
jgi:hypothetical protein